MSKSAETIEQARFTETSVSRCTHAAKCLKSDTVSSYSKDSSIPIRNRVLAALPRDEYDRLLQDSQVVRLPRNRILYEAGDATHYAYFLNGGMASLLAMTDDGQSIAIGNIGYEGFVGLPIIHRVSIAPYRVVMMMQGEALRVEATVLITGFSQNAKLRELLLRYAHVFETQLVQSFACSVPESLPRKKGHPYSLMS